MDITERKKTEEEREILIHDLSERIKELRCLYGIAESIRKHKAIEAIFRDVVVFISPGWHYPDITRGKILFDGKEYVLEPFEETEWRQTSDILIKGKRRGSVEVYYIEERPELDEGPFLSEERNLIDGIAQTLSEAIERKNAEEELQKAKDELEERVKDRTAELESAAELLQEEIKERKKAEEAIRNEKNKFINILNTMEDGVYIVNQQYDIEYINPVLRNEFGDIEGRKCYEYFHDRKEICPWCKNKKVFEGQTVRWEWFSFKNQRFYDLVDTPLRNTDGSISKLEIFRDITERKKMENELKDAKKEIEKWNKELQTRIKEKTEQLVKSQDLLIQSEKLSAMGQMAGGLAHELNSPLAGLLPLLEVFRNRAKKDSREYEELSLMLKSVNHMASIVKDFGLFSRKSKGAFTKLSLNEVIEDTLSFSAVKLRHKGIKIQKDFKESLPLVKGEKTELQQVVLNMISNASDSMPEGGRFTIKTDASEDKSRVTIEFIDNGTGIDKEDLNKIFDPFFTTKKTGEGTGLGLSISYGIIKRHEGEIIVESKPGKGTKFTISLPAVKSPRSKQ